MAFESFSDFLAMGNHGPYVWAAYGVFAIAMAWNILQPIWLRRRIVREQAAALRRADIED